MADTARVRDALEVADALFAAITDGRAEDVRELYADDAVIWHSNDELTQTPDDNVRTLQWTVRNLRGLRYTDIRRQPTADGFVQQHVLRATNRAGAELAIPVCIVCTVTGGRITRLDEYIDSAHVARVVERPQEGA